MNDLKVGRPALLDGSRLIIESCARAGADVYVGYPITPANLLFAYAGSRLPVLPAPDEISALQWMSGLSATGRLPMTATSAPGLALMVESINMAYMMELPMLIVLAQRLGPSTGTATAGAQGDLLSLQGLVSGGYPVPVLCISDMADCWDLPPVALRTAVQLRTPVVLLTSKEMIMTQRDVDLDAFGEIDPIPRPSYSGDAPYRPYGVNGHPVPDFLAVGDARHQVRLTASTHDTAGILQHTTPEALANTRRLLQKVEGGTPALFELDEQPGADTLIVTWGITTGAARAAVQELRASGHATSLLVAKTLLPVPPVYFEILDRYPRVVVAEENIDGQFARILFGRRLPTGVTTVNDIGKMIRPEQIVEEAHS